MLRRWLGVRSDQHTSSAVIEAGTDPNHSPNNCCTTQDPLAAVIGAPRQIYSVSRSVMLPRVALRSPQGVQGTGGGVGNNPLFTDHLDCKSPSHKQTLLNNPTTSVHHISETSVLRPACPPTAAVKPSSKPASSGYGSHGGSSHDPTYLDAVAVLEQNANFVKSILVAVQNKNKSRRSVGSLGSSAAGTLTLTTIPEGKIDFSIPRPVWPKRETNKKSGENLYDSLVDESLLLYTSLSYVPDDKNLQNNSANEILKELSDTINAAVDGKTGLSPEQVLKCISDRLSTGLEVLQKSTEEDMKKLSVNLSNSEQLNTVIRAFSNSSSSGNSSQSSSKCSAVDTEDIYQVPSGCSSSGFSGSSSTHPLPVFIHEDLSSVPNGMRNALIYGTLCRSTNTTSSSARQGQSGANERLLGGGNEKRAVVTPQTPTGGLLKAPPDAKPSVWEIYYGVGVVDGDVRMKMNDGDTPFYPAGRPEADFTLDVPRSELLTRRMRAAKKWRFRCRIVTSFLGLVFFLLSLMAVSLMLTRGKRMFGSMV